MNRTLYQNRQGETKNWTNLHLEPYDYWIYYLNIDFMSSVWNFCHWVTDVPRALTFPVARSKEKQLFSQAIKCRGLGIFPSYSECGSWLLSLENRKKQNQKKSLADPSNVGAVRKVFPHWSQKTITHYCISLFPIVSWLGYRTNCLLGLGEVPSCLIPRLLVVFTRQLRNLSDNPDLSLHNIGRR